MGRWVVGVGHVPLTILSHLNFQNLDLPRFVRLGTVYPSPSLFSLTPALPMAGRDSNKYFFASELVGVSRFPTSYNHSSFILSTNWRVSCKFRGIFRSTIHETAHRVSCFLMYGKLKPKYVVRVDGMAAHFNLKFYSTLVQP